MVCDKSPVRCFSTQGKQRNIKRQRDLRRWRGSKKTCVFFSPKDVKEHSYDISDMINDHPKKVILNDGGLYVFIWVYPKMDG